MTTKLIFWSNEIHLSQIYTALTMLHGQGEIELTQVFVDSPGPNLAADCPAHLKYARNWHCTVEADGVSYYIDVHDADDIDAGGLAACDVYLKRGYNPRKEMSPKVRPLGLNYPAFADGIDRFELERRLKLGGFKAVAKHLLKPQITVNDVASDAPLGEPAVLFLCRTWEAEKDSTPEKIAEREALNQSRADCIMALRKEFGSRCLAGFTLSPHALKLFPHATLDERQTLDRRPYLRLVRSIPICIATVGLHQSNPWKVGEYVANSRAIVSEQLYHSVPEFRAGQNYLEFTNPAECVAAVGALMDSKAKREELAAANRDYYLRRLRPDRLIASAFAAPR